MAFDLNEFQTNIQNYGYTSANKFDVQFTLPSLLNNAQLNSSSPENQSSLPSLLQFRCQHTVIPEVVMLTNDLPQYGMGSIKKQPYNAVFNNIPMTFLCDEGGLIHSFFYLWMNLVYNFSELTSNSSAIIPTPTTTNQFITPPTYTTNYDDDITAPVVNIFKYNNHGGLMTTINLYKVKPLIMMTNNLAWKQTNTLFKINIALNFREWSMTIPQTANKGSVQITN